MRIRAKFVYASILFAGMAPALLAGTPAPPASPLLSATGGQPVPARNPGTPPAETAAKPPQVTFRDGLLSIRAENSTLGDVLRAVHDTTGALIESPGVASERVYVSLGPGKPRDVLASLLNGSRFDYILLGSSQQPNSVSRVMLTMRQNSPITPVAAEPTPSSTPVANNEENDTPDETPDREVTPPVSGHPVRGQPMPNPTNAPDAAGQQPPVQTPNGQPPNGQPKTPEQLLRDLQQMQQQQQQQLQLQQQLMQQNNFSH